MRKILRMEGRAIQELPPWYEEDGCLWFTPTISRDEEVIQYTGKAIFRGTKIELHLAIFYAHCGNIEGEVLEYADFRKPFPFPATDIDVRRGKRGEWTAQNKTLLFDLSFFTTQDTTLPVLLHEFDGTMSAIERYIRNTITLTRELRQLSGINA